MEFEGVGIGESNFKMLRMQKLYFIDKSMYIKDIIDNDSKVVPVSYTHLGNTGTGTTQATTTTVPGADEGLETGSITASPAKWDNYKASTTLTTTTNFKIQYQVGSTSESGWSEAADSPVTVSNLDNGNTVYARLTDGTNAGDYAAINILDGTPPTVSAVSYTHLFQSQLWLRVQG